MIFRTLLFISVFTTLVFSQGMNLPETHDVTLDNGLRVIFIKDDYQPVLLLNLMINSGTKETKIPGTAKLLGNLLSKGTQDLTSSEFSNKKDINGASIGVQTGYTYIKVNMSCLASVQSEMLTLFSDMVLRPRLSTEEFDLLKTQMIVGLKESQTDNKWILNYFATKHYFPNESSWSKQSSIESLNKITIDDIKAYYLKTFTPRNATLVVRGNFTVELMKDKISKAFKTWDRPYSPSLKTTNTPFTQKPTLLIHKPKLTQTSIQLLHPGITFESSNYPAFRIINYALGAGGFSSRLTKVVRAEKGLTYSIYSATQTQPFQSVHKIQTFTRNGEVSETISSIKEVLLNLNKNGFSLDEFNDAQSFYNGYIPSQLESPATMSNWILDGLHKGLSIDASLNRYNELQLVTLDELTPLVTEYFNPNDFVLVVLGDKDVILDQLSTFGPIEIVNYTDL
jgi:zinc protease